ncbi:MAG: hypothetical protein AB7I27_04880 [Bacteriovoracaceae bacterium]
MSVWEGVYNSSSEEKGLMKQYPEDAQRSINLALLITSTSFAAELKNGTTLLKSSTNELIFEQNGRQQFLISKDIKTNKEIKKITIWTGLSDGALNGIEAIKTIEATSIIQFKGTDGDYSFFEVAVWNKETGDLAYLMGGDSLLVTLNLKSKNKLSIQLAEDDSAQDYGSVHTNLKSEDKTCDSKLTGLETVANESSAIIKKAGPVPQGEDSKKLALLNEKKQKLTPTQFEFDFTQFSKVKLICQ